MGSKKIHKKEDKKFRDFAYLDNRPATPAKFYYKAIRWAREQSGLQARQIEFMLLYPRPGVLYHRVGGREAKRKLPSSAR
jgi:hypothetical protein